MSIRRIQTFLFRWGPALLLMITIFMLSNTPAEQLAQVSDPVTQQIETAAPVTARLHIEWLKLGHVIGYAGLGLAFYQAFRSPRPSAQAIGLAVLACVLYALTDEFHQSFIPGRGASLRDVGLDALAAGSMLMIFSLVKMGKSLRNKKPPCS